MISEMIKRRIPFSRGSEWFSEIRLREQFTVEQTQASLTIYSQVGQAHARDRSYRPFFLPFLPGASTARKASFGMLMGPACRARRFLPSFCFMSSFFLRVMSPP